MVRSAVRQAFTLTEMMVIVAIIAIVLSIAVQYAGSSVAIAQRARCAANERQWGLALRAYGVDNQRLITRVLRALGLEVDVAEHGRRLFVASQANQRARPLVHEIEGVAVARQRGARRRQDVAGQGLRLLAASARQQRAADELRDRSDGHGMSVSKGRASRVGAFPHQALGLVGFAEIGEGLAEIEQRLDGLRMVVPEERPLAPEMPLRLRQSRVSRLRAVPVGELVAEQMAEPHLLQGVRDDPQAIGRRGRGVVVVDEERAAAARRTR